MEAKYKIDEREITLTVEPDGDNQFNVVVDEQSFAVRATAISPHQLQVKLDDAPAENQYFATCADGVWLWRQGRARLVQDATQAARRSSRSGLGGGPSEVTPPTPSTVVAVNAEVGQHVEKGEGLVVVSAMKMEITLTAPYAGTITAVNTEVGAKANPGEILVDIEADAEGVEDE